MKSDYKVRSKVIFLQMVEKIWLGLRKSTWPGYILALSGWTLYFFQAWTYAHIQTALQDEGIYLYIGKLFINGIIRPFQDYGTIRTYAPLAYLIPGQIEAWFGESLRTGRYLSIFFGMVMIAALWVTALRLGGKWWAAAIVWAIALTPISIQIYSLAITQALVACLLVGSLMFILGDERPLWSLVTGSILAGVTVMTRQNLAPLLPLVTAYIFWQHSKKAGWWSIAGCLLPILIVHIIYWPNVLELWAPWLPVRLTPFLNAFRIPANNTQAVAAFNFSATLQALLQGIRFHYFTMIGFAVCLFLWPGKDGWKSQINRRAAYFLAILLGILTLSHAGVIIFVSNPSFKCTFCFTPYLAFFDILAFLLIVVSVSSWRLKVSVLRATAIILFILFISAGLGYATFDRFGSWLLNFGFPAINRGLDPHNWVPFITLWDILANKFHQDYWTSRAPVSTITGLLVGTLALVFGKLLYNRQLKKVRGYSFSVVLLVILLGAGILLSPLMGGTYRDNGICHTDILRSYEQIGATLKQSIPENSEVYWGVDSAVPLLYASSIHVHYPQVYTSFAFRNGGNSDLLLKHGLWNSDLARKWLSESEYIVTGSNWSVRPEYAADLDLSKYKVVTTALTNPCDTSSYLLIYQKKP